MEKFLTGKTAIVTGGSRGIGRAIVGNLAEQGATVVFTYLHNQQQANELVETIAVQGGSARAIAADMAQPEDIDHLFLSVMNSCRRLDILINNAGIAIYKRFEDFTEQDINQIFDVNIKGVFLCCRHAARLMENNGSIINIGSTVTRVMLPTYGAYAASKGAVEQMSKVLARELGGRGIRVNTVSPGPIDTELFRAGKSDEQIARLAAQAALGRIGTVADVADLVTVLLDERSGWVTGQNILVNGGFAA
ncbi:SDR family oxidoreductase [Desulfobulbus alkaliphilus]|uniref:SDR family oxidoreductase n=1 Tax=Desulfobulbus alkaliphilus TaxID=869814 RepID=UPI001964910B|nr:SDR family oxidoreductase [Desulfobulbus alkaliphilus]MBM9535802.1 SDR family oxidoreductase [Desulfobulbus alkaliphilus]